MSIAPITPMELTFGERLRIVRMRAGIRQSEAADAAQGLLPSSMSLSREIIRRLEAGLIGEDKANPIHVAALARVYGVPLAELHPQSFDDFALVVGLSSDGDCPPPASAVPRSPTRSVPTDGQKIRELRTQQRMSQEQLAAAAGVSVGTIRRIEAGMGNGRTGTLDAIADALDCEVESLERGRPEVNPQSRCTALPAAA